MNATRKSILFENIGEFELSVHLELYALFAQNVHNNLDIYKWLYGHNALKHVVATFESESVWQALIMRVLQMDLDTELTDNVQMELDRDVYAIAVSLEKSLYWSLYALIAYKLVKWCRTCIADTCDIDTVNDCKSNEQTQRDLMHNMLVHACAYIGVSDAIYDTMSAYER